MFNSSKIASLDEQITSLNAELASTKASFEGANAELSTVKASLEAIKGEKATLEASVSDLTTKLSDAESAKTAAEAKAAAAEASVDTKVNERLASAGVEPIKRDPQAKQADAATMTRAEFGKLQHEQRDAFMRAGGKIVG